MGFESMEREQSPDRLVTPTMAQQLKMEAESRFMRADSNHTQGKHLEETEALIGIGYAILALCETIKEAACT